MKRFRSKGFHGIIFFASHLSFFLQFFLFGYIYLFLGLFAGLLVYNLSAQVFMHRGLAHGHYKFSSGAKKLLSTLFSFCNFGSIAANCAIHQRHHKFSDSAKDPHNFRKLGLWRTAIKDWSGEDLPHPREYAPFLRDKILLHQHRHNPKYAIFASILTPFIPVCSFWLINLLFVAVHTGSSDGNGSTAINLPCLYPLMWGEEHHAEHHKNPAKRKLHDFDLIYRIGGLFSATAKY
jgi:fatty-acid desaturase